MDRTADFHDLLLAPRIGAPPPSGHPYLSPDRVFGQQIAALVRHGRLHVAIGLIGMAKSLSRLDHAQDSLLQLSTRLDSAHDTALLEHVGQALAYIESTKAAAVGLPHA